MNMWSSGRRVLQDLFSQPAVRSFSRSPAQNTVVVERWWQVPLSKVGSPPRLHPRRHRIYKLVEDIKHAPKEKMELILTQTVPKLGGRGDTVFVKKSVGRNKLLLQGLAVYPSPENKQMFAEELRLLREGKPEERIQTRTGQLTVELLKRSKLKIIKMPSDEFQLTKEVVCRQFQKKLGVVVPLHALNLPFESVKDSGDYWCEVTVNGMDTVRIPISLVPYEDPSASYQRQLKTQMQQPQATTDVSEPAAEEEVAAAEEEVAAAEEEVAAAEEEVAAADGEAAVKAVSDATVEAEAGKDSGSQVSEAAALGVSADQDETAASTQMSQDTTAPPSDSPKKDDSK
ncbi:large ribosomal subunit protein bL9m isoform X2 [Perca flavescens]|uniref:large ribosomal subunit protein bL9m isoform X2 n=1 Tax=Perca flavescens TaxID=8167 RepID=UPI00106EAB98|nr:39S ribosomal protein L9, mitochondrial isoform X2 [Perca flavescens]